MSWSLSRFRAGDLVEVRSKEEILATLDRRGCLDGMPFMPEMLQYCGRRFRIGAVAHKTCDVAHQTLKSRRLQTTVHLAGARCDGSMHGGCEAECNLFWKDSWLRLANGGGALSVRLAAAASRGMEEGVSETELPKQTRLVADSEHQEPRYSCQATKLFDATEPMAWWNPRQYLYDVITRNYSVRHVVSVLFIAFLKHLNQRAPRGYRLTKALHKSMHCRLMGRELPNFCGKIGKGQPTPTGRLDLKPGERVRIKSKEEIEKTLDVSGRNRGLYFDVELSSYCGRVVTVRKLVTKIINELTGKMRHMNQPCIMLEGVACRAEYSECRLMCPRAIPSYWREIWLERVESDCCSADDSKNS